MTLRTRPFHAAACTVLGRASSVARVATVGLLGLLSACSSRPPQPDWQLNASDALQRSLAAYLAGDARIETQEFAKARGEVARTGRADLLARTELARCASRTASLVVEECTGFEALRADAAPPELAYADYLTGRVRPQDVALLPEQHRATASALAATQAASPAASPAALPAALPASLPAASPASASANDAPLPEATDPLARLVAAGALFRAGRAGPALIASAIDTASAQGWRRPLLAWLNVQMEVARQGGDGTTEALARRRIAIVLGSAASAGSISAVNPASAANAASAASRP